MADISKTAAGKITGGHLLARALKDKGINRIFSLCGGFINPILIGCHDYDIDVVGCRSEMEAGFMAAATARLTREVSVCLAEPSGFTNYISAVAEACFAGDPVIFIGVSANTHHFDNKGFKELPQQEIVRSMTKYSIEVNEAERIAWFLDKAYDIASNHPTGPVQLTVPTNFLFTGRIDAEPEQNIRSFDPTRRKVHRPCPNPDDLQQVENLLSNARCPAIIAGNHVWFSHAEEELGIFAEKHGIPILAPFTHLKSMDMAHPMHVGLFEYHQNPASRLVSEECDVMLVLGSELGFALNQGTAPLFNVDTRVITVNATARELSDNMLSEVRVCSDLKMFIQHLNRNQRVKPADPDWIRRIREQRQQDLGKYEEIVHSNDTPIHPIRLCFDILMSLGENDILVIDGGDIACWAEIALNRWAFENRKIGRILAPGPWEQMGTGPAFATAAKMANPDAHVVLITGDGSLGLAPGLTPMETAIDRAVAVTMIVANNAQWGMIREQQKAMWEREIATRLRDVDYHAIFAAAGAHSRLVTATEDIVPALEQARESRQPAFIEVKTLGVASPITHGLIDMRVRTAIE